MIHSVRLAVVLVASLGAGIGFPHDGARAATTGAAWSANGAAACGEYLTPAVTSAILQGPAGKTKSSDATSCNEGPIYLKLKAGNVSAFRRELPLIAGAHPISGIGDAAYWNEAGAVSAVKGDRACDISVIIPGAAKVSGSALAEKLGAICNQLFALP
jgi:hypothetical protein